MDWTRWRTKEELFHGSDRWHQEKVKDFCGRSIVRKTDSRLYKGEDVVVCLPGARIETIYSRSYSDTGKGGSILILVHIGTNNAEMERFSYASDNTACFLVAVN